MRNIKACLYVSPGDRTTLERLVADGKTAQKIVARARIALLSTSPERDDTILMRDPFED